MPFDRLPGWNGDDFPAALRAFRSGCAAIPSRQTLGGGGDAARLGGSPAAWSRACQQAQTTPEADAAAARRFFEASFQAYAVHAGARTSGLFTGYYEPEARGAERREAGYATPLLRHPADLVEADLGAFAADLSGRKLRGRVADGRLVPYYDRAAIRGGALSGRGLEILWLADPVDAFFVEIQGSARVRLPDGTVRRVSYAGENGRPYVPIGRVLVDRGELPREAVSLQSIRAWLAAHPQQADEVMDENPSYVFFRTLPQRPATEGPPGSLGAPLTPGRSLAVDPAFVPLGAPVWLDTTDPLDGSPVRRLLLAQDTGGAIKGPIRGDVFWGWGADAEARAGRMRAPGTLYLLLPR